MATWDATLAPRIDHRSHFHAIFFLLFTSVEKKKEEKRIYIYIFRYNDHSVGNRPIIINPP